MNLNMFRVLDPNEQAAIQEYADQDEWRIACLNLGASPDQVATYEQSARRFAAASFYPNDRIITEARRAAKDMLLRGESMPQDAEHTLQMLWARELRRMLNL
jgi:hypothetical protein